MRALLLASTFALLVAPALRAAPGLAFRETMRGRMTWGALDPTSGAEDPAAQPVALKARISTPDADAFFADPTHPLGIEGRFEVRVPGERKARRFEVEDGVLNLLEPGEGLASADADARRMVYTFRLRDASGRRFHFRGAKTLRDDQGADMIRDTTTLYSVLRRGGPSGPPVAQGILRFQVERPWVVMKFLASFRVPGASGWRQRARVIRRFLKLYLGSLAELYL